MNAAPLPPTEGAGTPAPSPGGWAMFREIMKHGGEWLRPQRKGLVLAAGLGLAVSLAHILAAQLCGTLVSTLSLPAAERSAGLLVGLLLGWVVCVLAAPLLSLIERVQDTRVDGLTQAALRTRLMATVLGRPPAFFHAHPSGELGMLLRETATECCLLAKQVIVEMPMQMVAMLVTLVVAAMHLTWMGLGSFWGAFAILAGLLVLTAFVARILSRRGQAIREVSDRLRKTNMRTAGFVNDTLNSVSEIQAFRGESWIHARLRDMLAQWVDSRVLQTRSTETFNLFTGLPSVLVQVLLLGTAVVLAVLSGKADSTQAGGLVTLVQLVPQLMLPLQAFAACQSMVQSGWPAFVSVRELLDYPVEQAGPESAGSLAGAPVYAAPAAAFREVNFAYSADSVPILEGFSADFPAGSFTALAGRIGTGKSTLFRLLLGFHQAGSGLVTLDGADVEGLPLHELRSRVAMLRQSSLFTNDSLRTNLLLANPHADDATLIEALRTVKVYERLRAALHADTDEALLNAPLATGSIVSGGQGRLLALARCLIRKPSLLCLDEPGANVDGMEKREMAAQLRAACKGMTVIVIDHDVEWLAEWCDRFVVLDQGRAIYEGPADEAFERCALLRQLAKGNREKCAQSKDDARSLPAKALPARVPKT